MLKLTKHRFQQRELSELFFKVIAGFDESFAKLRQQGMIQRWEHVVQHMIAKVRECHKQIRFRLDAVNRCTELINSEIESFELVTFVDNGRSVMAGVECNNAVQKRAEENYAVPNDENSLQVAPCERRISEEKHRQRKGQREELVEIKLLFV